MPFCQPPNLEPEQQQMDLQCCSAPQGSAHVRVCPRMCVCVCVCVCVTTPGLTSGFYQNRRLWVIMAGPGLTSNAVMDYGLVRTLVLVCVCVCVCVCLCLCETGHLHSLLTFPSFLYTASLLLFISPSLLLSGDSLQRLLSQREKSQLFCSQGSAEHSRHTGTLVFSERKTFNTTRYLSTCVSCFLLNNRTKMNFKIYRQSE